MNGWRTSSRTCDSGACVEVGQGPAVVGVRDSTDRGGPVLVVSGEAWDDFLYGIRQGAYLVPGPGQCVRAA